MERTKPGPEQESSWDYPKPPVVQETSRRVEVFFGGQRIADTTHALRLLESRRPPVYYIPIADVVPDVLAPSARATYNEYVGEATYFRVTVGERQAEDAAWRLESPRAGYEQLARHVAFYAQLMDRCLVGGERVKPQPGEFARGWITSDVVGPFKGEPGTRNW